MNLTLSFSSIKKTAIAFLHRFHVMIFVFIVLNGSIIVILLLNGNIITSGKPSDYTPASNDTTFDQATIQRIKELKTHDQSGSGLDLSHGRTNPFVE
jgi:hypothetical protein